MNDLPAEWVEPTEDELGPHGQPIPPPTWTPEREAEVARWRDELMAAGEARDRQYVEQMNKLFTRISWGHASAASVAISRRMEIIEVKFWYAIWRHLKG